MASFLVKSKKQQLAAADERKLGDLIKPLVNEIFLFETVVSDTANVSDRSILNSLHPGDSLTLRRENTRYDDGAIAVYDENGHKLGFIPEKDNVVFSRLMDAGKLLKAKIKTIKDLGSATKINILIYLVDY